MRRFAQETSVSPEQTRLEIEHTVRRYGADQFAFGTKAEGAIVGFRMKDRYVRFSVAMPSDEELSVTQAGRHRNKKFYGPAREQEERRRWRALYLVIKAKLEAVETRIATFDQEFMSHIVMPDGRTVGEHMLPQIAAAYRTGKMPALLPAWDGQ